MIAVRIIVWIARVAGVGALILGLLFWIFQVDLLTFHMLFGLTLTLAFLVLSIVLVFTKGIRLLGAIGVLYALIIPVFGLTQATLLIGSAHWLIETAHMLVGVGALALVQVMYVRYNRLKLATPEAAAQNA